MGHKKGTYKTKFKYTSTYITDSLSTPSFI